MGFFGRLWRGDVSLFTTYWIFGGLVMFMFNMFEQSTRGISEDAHFTGLMVSLFYYSFLSVAIWRSSLKYRGPQMYSVLAQGTVAVGWLRYVWIFFMPDMGSPFDG